MGSLFDSELITSLATSAIRNIAVAAGAALVHNGVITSSQTNDLIGSLLCLFGVAWSLGRHIVAKQAELSAQKGPSK